MPGGRVGSVAELPETPRAMLSSARRAVLSTIDRHGDAHSVPVCFALRGDEIISAIDHKPKSTQRPARIKNIERTGRATLLADHYEETWERVGWVMVRAAARAEELSIEPPELLEKYPQYQEIELGEGLIVLEPDSILWWTYS